MAMVIKFSYILNVEALILNVRCKTLEITFYLSLHILLQFASFQSRVVCALRRKCFEASQLLLRRKTKYQPFLFLESPRTFYFSLQFHFTHTIIISDFHHRSKQYNF